MTFPPLVTCGIYYVIFVREAKLITKIYDIYLNIIVNKKEIHSGIFIIKRHIQLQWSIKTDFHRYILFLNLQTIIFSNHSPLGGKALCRYLIFHSQCEFTLGVLTIPKSRINRGVQYSKENKVIETLNSRKRQRRIIYRKPYLLRHFSIALVQMYCRRFQDDKY